MTQLNKSPAPQATGVAMTPPQSAEVVTALSALAAATHAMSAAAEAVTASVISTLAPQNPAANDPSPANGHPVVLPESTPVVGGDANVPAPLTDAAPPTDAVPSTDAAPPTDAAPSTDTAALAAPANPFIQVSGPWRAGVLYGVVPLYDLEAVPDNGEKWFAITRGRYVGLTKNSAISLHAVTGVSTALSDKLNSQAEALEYFNDALRLNAVRVLA
ncbi:hypothetical protein B0H11DRAFT_1920495 [Mycena galericulata]|nr:hypothetical protein B0H11DRAFT_1920495 [Mycena galericulata]